MLCRRLSRPHHHPSWWRWVWVARFRISIRTGTWRPLRTVEGWRRTLWRCRLRWRPLRRRCLSLPWLSPRLTGKRLPFGVVTNEAVGDVGSSSAIVAPRSSSGKRRKSKKRRVQRDLTHLVPLVPESDGSSSPPRKQVGSGGPRTLAAVVELLPARAACGAWRCSGPCRTSTDGPADAFSLQ